MDKETVIERWTSCKATYDTRYDSCDSDWKFLHGIDQWDAKIKKKRDRQSRPSLVLNQLQPYYKQVVNEIRQSNLAIRVSPVDDRADIDTAEIYQGIIRNIERQSDAQVAYTTAAGTAVGAGIGWIVVDVDYVDNDSFDQEPRIRRILDFKSVYIDPASNELDGRDAEFAFIVTEYTEEQFEKDYPGAEPISFEAGTTDDMIVVVEHYYKDYKTETLYQIEVEGEILTVDSDQKKIIDEDGTVPYEIKAERKVDVVSVKHHVYGGQEEPLSESEFPCDFIPVVPVIGEEVYIDGVREFQSLIHHAKDAQRMFNYWKSAGTEFIALQPKAPWIGPKGSFKSYPQKWAHANTENFTTLEFDIVYDDQGIPVPPPQRAPPIQGSPAMMQEAVSAKEDIRLSMGMPLANMGESSNEISGIAVRNRQIYGDNATFHFVDNLSTSISQVGRILVDMIPRLYSERKIARILGEDGTPENIPVNTPFIEDDEGVRPVRHNEEATGIYDLNAGKYDVVCDVGASYSSQRQEMADKLAELYQKDPALMATTGDLFFKALDMPLGAEISERLQSQMDPALLGNDPQGAKLQEAAQAMQQMQEQLANMDAALQDKETNTKFDQAFKAEEMQLKRDQLALKVQETQADIAKTYSEIEGNKADTNAQRQENMDHMRELADKVSDIGGAMELILGDIEEGDIEVDVVTTEPVESVAMLDEGE